VLDRGAQRPALEKTEETMEMFGIFSSLDERFNQAHASKTDGNPNVGSEAGAGDYDFAVDPVLDTLPE
jgi:hypothetical protein